MEIAKLHAEIKKTLQTFHMKMGYYEHITFTDNQIEFEANIDTENSMPNDDKLKLSRESKYICCKYEKTIMKKETNEVKEYVYKNDIELINEVKEKLMKHLIYCQVKYENSKRKKDLYKKIENLDFATNEKADEKFINWKKGIKYDKHGNIKIMGLIEANNG